MIYELRIYTLAPGTQGEFLRLNRDVGNPIRGDKYGRRVGGWTTEFGTLNQYVHLWSYDDLNERARLRRGLAQDEAWAREYVPKIMPLLLTQQNTILYADERVPFAPPDDGGRHVYELRSYRTQPGKTKAWLDHFVVGLEARQKYSKIVGLWSSDVGGLNQVVHLWAYRDLVQRAEARARATTDPDWQAFLGKGMPLLAEMQAVILVSTEASPLQ